MTIRPDMVDLRDSGWTSVTSPRHRVGTHDEQLCGRCGTLLVLDGRPYADHLWVGSDVTCHLCGSVNPMAQALVAERN